LNHRIVNGDLEYWRVLQCCSREVALNVSIEYSPDIKVSIFILENITLDHRIVNGDLKYGILFISYTNIY